MKIKALFLVTVCTRKARLEYRQWQHRPESYANTPGLKPSVSWPGRQQDVHAYPRIWQLALKPQQLKPQI
jgi:hypothetical protein